MVVNKKSRKESTLKKILKVPLRVLARAMDFYMKGMAEYSDQVCVMSCPTGNFNNMPRSYSVSSTNPNHLDDDHRDLLRAASTGSNLGSRNKKINANVPARQQYSHTKSATRVGDNMPRSHSVPPIGRIDEETPCDFDEEDVKVMSSVCPRSRSYAVSKRISVKVVVFGYFHSPALLVCFSQTHKRKLISEPCWTVTYNAALTLTQPVVDPELVKALDPLPHTWRCSSSPIKQRHCPRLSSKLLSFGLDKSSSFGGFAQGIFPDVQSFWFEKEAPAEMDSRG
ncbi:hypothetical protein OIU76_006403 [Salix suchowensis]|nr:hypothetical protein OIU76_006403 [Salix suchowensis]